MEDTLRDLQQRVAQLERTVTRYRAGTVTGVAPLAVSLGASPTAYNDVRAVGPATTGDQVATLVWGNDLLVLGRLGASGSYVIGGPVTTAWPGAASRSTIGTVTHGLGTTPRLVICQPTDNTTLTADPVLVTFTYTATQFSFRAQTVDGQLPANTVTRPSFNWIAYA